MIRMSFSKSGATRVTYILIFWFAREGEADHGESGIGERDDVNAPVGPIGAFTAMA